MNMGYVSVMWKDDEKVTANPLTAGVIIDKTNSFTNGHTYEIKMIDQHSGNYVLINDDKTEATVDMKLCIKSDEAAYNKTTAPKHILTEPPAKLSNKPTQDGVLEQDPNHVAAGITQPIYQQQVIFDEDMLPEDKIKKMILQTNDVSLVDYYYLVLLPAITKTRKK